MKIVKEAIRKLKATALPPLDWEIKMLGKIELPKERLTACRERDILEEMNRLSKIDKELTTDSLSNTLGVTVGAVENLLKEVDNDLQTELDQTYQGDFKKAPPDNLARFIFDWFENGAGGKFFKTEDDKVFLFYKGTLFEINDNLRFSSLLHSLTGMNFAERPGSVVWKILQNLCYTNGVPVEQLGWCFTDRQENAIYINLKIPHHKIIRLSAGRDPELLENGTNDHGVLLTESFQMKPFTYKPDVDRKSAMEDFKRLLMDTTPAETPQRYFLACWMFTSFLMDFQSDRGLLQVIGVTQTGKSKVAERISQLLLGDVVVGQGTGASNVRIATQSPIVFLDNIENRDLNKDRLNFMLLLANSSPKPKARAGSDTEVVMHKLKSMGMITSIEPFPGKYPELINRTFVLNLSTSFKKRGYNHDSTLNDIAMCRDEILSAFFQIVTHEVLPNLDERNYWSEHLNDHYPAHTKERNNEHICTMMVVMEALFKIIPWKAEASPRHQAVKCLEAFIKHQDEHARDTALTSNTLLSLLDSLAKELKFKVRGKSPASTTTRDYPRSLYPDGVVQFDDPEYMHSFYFVNRKDLSDDPDGFMEETEFLEFEFSSSDLQTILSRSCKAAGMRYDIDNPTTLGARLSNDREVLEAGGWAFITKAEGSGIRWKKVNGKNIMKMAKRMGVVGDR